MARGPMQPHRFTAGPADQHIMITRKKRCVPQTAQKQNLEPVVFKENGRNRQGTFFCEETGTYEQTTYSIKSFTMVAAVEFNHALSGQQQESIFMTKHLERCCA